MILNGCKWPQTILIQIKWSKNWNNHEWSWIISPQDHFLVVTPRWPAIPPSRPARASWGPGPPRRRAGPTRRGPRGSDPRGPRWRSSAAARAPRSRRLAHTPFSERSDRSGIKISWKIHLHNNYEGRDRNKSINLCPRTKTHLCKCMKKMTKT